MVRVVNKTTEIELSGISIAATNGDSTPSIANVSPAALYKNDIITTSTFQDIQASGKMILTSIHALQTTIDSFKLESN